MNPQQKYRLKYPERIRISKEKWRKVNLDKHAAHSKAWRDRNPEEAKATNKRYMAANPEYIAYKTRKRRALLKNVRAEYYRRVDVYNRDKGICQLCGQFIEIDLAPRTPLSFTVDHITPLSLGGDDCFNNVRSAHYSCNSSRGNRI